MPRPRVLMLVNPDRCEVEGCLDEVRRIVASRAQIAAEHDTTTLDAPPTKDVDLAVIIGGDGTLLSQARRLVESAIPLVGINFGRLGFLAEFDLESLEQHADLVFGPRPPMRTCMILRAAVLDAAGKTRADRVAINDCIITAGPPYRMIELGIEINGDDGPVLSGDGVIVATPTGSTAYNVSSGGPIVEQGVEAFIITPLSPHSLAFRPIVVGAQTRVTIHVRRPNPGTTLVLDGQEQIVLLPGERVRIERHAKHARFVTNPSMSYWRILIDKMRWAAPPTYRDRGA